MRRKDKEIVEREEMEAVLAKGHVLHLGMCAANEPYVVPMNYGWKDGSVYVHCAPKGRKMDMLRANPTVCFVVLGGHAVRIEASGKACAFGMRYESVMGVGKAEEVLDRHEKEAAFACIVRQCTDAPFHLSADGVDTTVVLRIRPVQLTGKRDAK
ncbi:MAG: pyridoxamine 5'-phosphate oxidase family protein [Desulfovibrionaceae bacterium]